MTERFDGNFCRYFANIEKDPKAVTPQMTVGEFLQARIHVGECKACAECVDRVLDVAPQGEGPNVSLN